MMPTAVDPIPETWLNPRREEMIPLLTGLRQILAWLDAQSLVKRLFVKPALLIDEPAEFSAQLVNVLSEFLLIWSVNRQLQTVHFVVQSDKSGELIAFEGAIDRLIEDLVGDRYRRIPAEDLPQFLIEAKEGLPDPGSITPKFLLTTAQRVIRVRDDLAAEITTLEAAAASTARLLGQVSRQSLTIEQLQTEIQNLTRKMGRQTAGSREWNDLDRQIQSRRQELADEQLAAQQWDTERLAQLEAQVQEEADRIEPLQARCHLYQLAAESLITVTEFLFAGRTKDILAAIEAGPKEPPVANPAPVAIPPSRPAVLLEFSEAMRTDLQQRSPIHFFSPDRWTTARSRWKQDGIDQRMAAAGITPLTILGTLADCTNPETYETVLGQVLALALKRRQYLVARLMLDGMKLQGLIDATDSLVLDQIPAWLVSLDKPSTVKEEEPSVMAEDVRNILATVLPNWFYPITRACRSHARTNWKERGLGDRVRTARISALSVVEAIQTAPPGTSLGETVAKVFAPIDCRQLAHIRRLIPEGLAEHGLLDNGGRINLVELESWTRRGGRRTKADFQSQTNRQTKVRFRWSQIRTRAKTELSNHSFLTLIPSKKWESIMAVLTADCRPTAWEVLAVLEEGGTDFQVKQRLATLFNVTEEATLGKKATPRKVARSYHQGLLDRGVLNNGKLSAKTIQLILDEPT